jgi:2-phosphosulfolactate phosphatase
MADGTLPTRPGDGVARGRRGRRTTETRMLELDLVFVPPHPGEPHDVAVVVDVLRMTTTATVLFARGLHELFVVADADEAARLARTTGASLFGERGGLPLPGFDGGNSPVERLHDDLTGQSAILCTTNGSGAVEAVASARHVLLGALVNARAVARTALTLVDRRILLVCAGTHGAPSLDDVLGAGQVIAEVVDLTPTARLTDAARMASLLAADARGVAATLDEARHAHTLRELGFGADVAFAARPNGFDVVAQRVGDRPTRFRRAE